MQKGFTLIELLVVVLIMVSMAGETYYYDDNGTLIGAGEPGDCYWGHCADME